MNTTQTRTINLSQIVFDENIYPRKRHDPALVQRYADIMDEIEARNHFISVSHDNVLLDGRHRHLAYLKIYNGTPDDHPVTVFSYDAPKDEDKFTIAVQLNNDAGWQLDDSDKRRCAIDFYSKYHKSIQEIAKLVSARKQTVLEWTKGAREEEECRQNEVIFDLYLACYTEEEIANQTKLTQQTIGNRIEKLLQKEFLGTKFVKLSRYEDEDWKPPLYNVWRFNKLSNDIAHFGNSEQSILENLLYLYTSPLDIVLDPFAGGGSTIEICKNRMRRYWVSDRKPIVEREKEIRQMDICQELPPLNKRWSDVSLTYLDPPYWKQAAGQYSEDARDLANMPLPEFTEKAILVVRRISEKQSRGAIAMLMQPTQWNAPERQFTDHVFNIINGVGNKRLILENRVSCPYTSEQANAQMVDWAKANKKLLVISRELIIWKLI